MEIEEYMKLLGKSMAEKRGEAALNILKGSAASYGFGGTQKSSFSTSPLKSIYLQDGDVLLMTTADLITDIGVVKQTIPEKPVLFEKQEGQMAKDYIVFSIRTKKGVLTKEKTEHKYKWIHKIGNVTDDNFKQYKDLIHAPEEWF